MKMFRFRGFTLIEVLIALVILSISLISLYKLNGVSISSERKASELGYYMQAAKYLMNRILSEGYPATGKTEGKFEEGAFNGIIWKKNVESFNLPMLEDIRKVTIEIYYKGKLKYSLSTLVSKYR